MKTLFQFLFPLSLLLTITSCDDTDPVKKTDTIPLRMETPDYIRELIFDENNRLSGIKMTSLFPNDIIHESTLHFHYSASGRIDSSGTTEGHRFKYTYEDGHLTRSDEFIDNVFTQYHTFAYDSRDRLIENLSWQYIPEEGGWIPHQKSTYTYGPNDNLAESVLYYHDSGSKQHKLLTKFIYNDYDDKKNADNLFNIIPFNPNIRFRKNNPGKMVVENMHGNTTSIETYTHQYNDAGFPEKRITTLTFPHNGETGSYETQFVYDRQ